jgi:dihydrodipicolinate synthase/N-acetylneuraminate lyase
MSGDIEQWREGSGLGRYAEAFTENEIDLDARVYPLARAFYAPPFLDMHDRMKELLVHRGKILCAAVRPPLSKLLPHELDHIEKAAREAGLMVA